MDPLLTFGLILQYPISDGDHTINSPKDHSPFGDGEIFDSGAAESEILLKGPTFRDPGNPKNPRANGWLMSKEFPGKSNHHFL